MKIHSIHTVIFSSLVAIFLMPSLRQTLASKATPETDLPQNPQIYTVRELAGDPKLISHNGDDFRIYRYVTAQKAAVPSVHTADTYRFLVQGGLHGNEKLGSSFVLWLAQRVAAGESPLNQLQAMGASFDFLPYANPDGTHSHSRYNSRGVNLNRNFGILWGIAKENPGDNSFSEPETRAIRYLFKARQYTAAIDVHGYINWVVEPSEPAQVSLTGVSPHAAQIKTYTEWTASIRKEMKLLTGYQLKTAGGLGDGGAFEDWAFWSQGTMALCLELARDERFQTNYRRTFADITTEEKSQDADSFLKYEMFVFRMFDHAIKIKQAAKSPSELAAQ